MPTTYAIIENSSVVNIAVAESPSAFAEMTIMEARPWTRIGDTLKDGRLPEEYQTSPQEALNRAYEALADRRKKAEYGGFLHNGVLWGSEEKDEMRLNSLIALMEKNGMTSFTGWKLAGGGYCGLTLEQAWEAASALMLHYSACFSVEQQKRAELEGIEATTAAQVVSWLDANLESGWPGGE